MQDTLHLYIYESNECYVNAYVTIVHNYIYILAVIWC